jgi:hypothetical protein
MSTNIVWLSVDPVNHKIDYYPKEIAKKIENEYKKFINNNNDFNNNDFNNNNLINKCILGTSFFNATVHFNKQDNNFFQTTPGFGSGRFSGKPPGYRSVKRIEFLENDEINILCKFNNNELRICKDNEINFDKVFKIIIPKEYILKNDNLEINSELNIWNPDDINEDLETFDENKNIVIWEWCNSNREENNNLVNLEDKWWFPYLFDQNRIIEEGFINKKNVKIILQHDNTERLIKFYHNSMFAKQIDEVNNKVRLVRRNIISIKKLIKLLNKKKPINYNEIFKNIDEKNIPDEFYCSISQEIMKDPVKTIDGFTYDRNSIQTWFNISNKSPLTGLYLNSTELIPNDELREQIIKFTEIIMNK